MFGMLSKRWLSLSGHSAKFVLPFVVRFVFWMTPLHTISRDFWMFTTSCHLRQTEDYVVLCSKTILRLEKNLMVFWSEFENNKKTKI
jgi:hypothetical protein